MAITLKIVYILMQNVVPHTPDMYCVCLTMQTYYVYWSIMYKQK